MNESQEKKRDKKDRDKVSEIMSDVNKKQTMDSKQRSKNYRKSKKKYLQNLELRVKELEKRSWDSEARKF
jgi:DUF4097 and DUF4098 domain-containing protein YvlB